MPIESTTAQEKGQFGAQPQTSLGRRLWELRKQILASSEPLLGWKQIEEEIADRRGNLDEDNIR